jgi:peptidoglycan/xylan/chitin deacetylase (PgdA/CDA1 family)
MKRAIARILTSRPGRGFFRRILGDRVAIFALHRFCEPGSGASGHDPGFAREVLSDLRENEVPLLSLRKVVHGLAEGRPMRGVCFTVDDGYQNFFHLGAPVFQEFDCPVTVFLTTGFIDGEYWFWWDKIRYGVQNTPLGSLTLPLSSERVELGDGRHRIEVARMISARIKTLPQSQRDEEVKGVLESLETEVPHQPPAAYEPLSWDQVRALNDSSFDFGPHSVRHPSFGTAGFPEIRNEVRESFARLKETLANPLPIFCYPYGTLTDVSNQVAAIVEKEQMDGAVTMIPGYVRTNGTKEVSRFLIPRFGMPDSLVQVRQIGFGIERGKDYLRTVVSGYKSKSDNWL